MEKISWNLNKLFTAPKYEESDVEVRDGVKSILYQATPYKGKPVEVYAYYAAPDGVAPEGGWPAVVCVHGGGGTAFDVWVKKWNAHGFAAISMDLEGHYPVLKENPKDNLDRVPTPNPGPSRVGVFHDFREPIEDSWFKQAVQQSIIAHSLIRSFPEINKDKIGVTGISWGGMITSALICVDNRFKFAIPVYGCGYLIDTDGHMGKALTIPKQQEIFTAFLGNKESFGKVTIPVLWVNGSNDGHFPLSSHVKTANATTGENIFHFPVRMPHGHGAGWQPEEIYAFAKSVVSGGKSLLKVGQPQKLNDVWMVKVEGEVKEAELCYTLGGDKRQDFEWKVKSADKGEDSVSATIAKEAVAFYFNITDERGFIVSTAYTTNH